ncbi:SufD family Fe-S cluster assembly protein [Pseudenhygromyxa sp. WMMC2535]|uniref:SufD family Fe-S cluster assembly protein n=1 Tax=Pseudenhygromyxa sp. WMMC2535 TaxID=2712867 RepID=UPI001557460E|nr:SufD family Fe-S cluster assembly protein [Pseudenhygromyxa sp. WMMC2535]NVB41156.1 SufD family Fe-S cluster assembly protein [Pseudenhygromyxa sp. WMMC2535]
MLTEDEIALLREVGFEDEGQRAATSVLADQALKVAHSNHPEVVLMPLAEALQKFDFVQDLMFGLVSPEENEHIREAAEQMDDPIGHFLWVRPGAKLRLPVQNFTLFEKPQARQFTHDITLIDEGADVELISGTAVPRSVHAGRHISISETYLRPGAAYSSITVEHWGPSMEIFSYGYSRLEAGARCTATSVAVAQVGTHTSVSRSALEAGASEIDRSVLFAPEGSRRVSESETRLVGAGARSEQITRMVSAGGTIHTRARLVGEAADTSGFLGCDGLKLGDAGEILSVPELLARVEGTSLSHEASVGMISRDKLTYLMASGLDEDAARDLIVRGFLDLGDTRLPAAVRQRVESLVVAAKAGGM